MEETKTKKISIFPLVVAFVALGLTIASFVLKNPGSRRVFYFENRLTGNLVTEIRYLPKESAQGKYNYFIDELLLGPLDGNLAPLFSSGTKVDFCFLRGGVLYVNLSKEAVWEENDAVPVKKGCALLVKNIKKNFPSVKEVTLYIDNNELTNF